MFERYTDPAKRIIFFARLEANHRLEDHITPKDILAGLAWESGSRAMRIAPLKENAVLFRSLVGIPHLPISSTPYLEITRDIPLDKDAKMVLAYAASEADRDKEYWVDSDHLLRGLLRIKNPAATALKSIGLDLKTLRTESRNDRNALPPISAPEWARLGLTWNKWKGRLRDHAELLFFIALLVLLIFVLKFRSPV